METVLILLVTLVYMTIHYLVTDHDTAADKDRRRFQRGLTMLDEHQFEEAYTFFNEAVKRNPKSAIAYAWRAKSQLALGNHYSAIYDLTQAISRDNTLADCYLDKGMAHLEVDEPTEAFREFDKAVWHFRDENAGAYRWRAVARIAMGQAKQAHGDLRRAIHLGDEDAVLMLRKLTVNR